VRSEQNLSLSTRSSPVFIFKILIFHVVNIFKREYKEYKFSVIFELVDEMRIGH